VLKQPVRLLELLAGQAAAAPTVAPLGAETALVPGGPYPADQPVATAQRNVPECLRGVHVLRAFILDAIVAWDRSWSAQFLIFPERLSRLAQYSSTDSLRGTETGESEVLFFFSVSRLRPALPAGPAAGVELWQGLLLQIGPVFSRP
jgi:hypothetical protein